MRGGLLGLLIGMCASANAQQQVELCQFECTEQQVYLIKDDTWKNIQALFQHTDKDAEQERLAIANAIALMEQDIYAQVIQQLGEEGLQDYLLQMFSNVDETRNSRTMIALLTDQHLVYRHVIRRSEKRQAVFGPTQSTAVIQCIDDARIYAMDATSTGFGYPPQIQFLQQWKSSTPVKKLAGQITDMIDRLIPSDNRENSREQR